MKNDVPAWCRINGHRVLDIREQGGEIIIRIEILNRDNDPVTGLVIENHSDNPAPIFYVDDIRFVGAKP